jgi:hypothetical protein
MFERIPPQQQWRKRNDQTKPRRHFCQCPSKLTFNLMFEPIPPQHKERERRKIEQNWRNFGSALAKKK